MKAFNLFTLMLMLFLLYPIPEPALQLNEPDSSLMWKCPASIKEWKKMIVTYPNRSEFENCLAALKKDYMASKKGQEMDLGAMHEILIVKYNDLISFYEDGDGDDPDKADEFKEDLKELEKKKPPKSKKAVKKKKSDN